MSGCAGVAFAESEGAMRCRRRRGGGVRRVEGDAMAGAAGRAVAPLSVLSVSVFIIVTQFPRQRTKQGVVNREFAAQKKNTSPQYKGFHTHRKEKRERKKKKKSES